MQAGTLTTSPLMEKNHMVLHIAFLFLKCFGLDFYCDVAVYFLKFLVIFTNFVKALLVDKIHGHLISSVQS